MSNNVALLRNQTGRLMVLEICKEKNLSIDVLEDLIDIELSYQGMLRKRGIGTSFNEVFDGIDETEEE